METNKPLGLWILISLVIGNVIGSGVFLLPASLAQYGTIGIVGWICTSAGAVCLALVFAHLSRLYPRTGGPYAYCREAFGEFIGFQVAYNYWIALWVGNAAVIIAFVSYFSFFFPVLATNRLASFCTASGVLWLVTLVNVIGVRQAGVVQVVFTILKLIPLLAIMGLGMFFIKPHYLSYFNITGNSNLHALTGAATLTLWSFIGLESATVPAENVENPTRNIPRATIIGTLIAAVVYILCTTAIMGIIPAHQLAQSNSPFADAAFAIFGEYGGAIVACGAIAATFGAINGWVLMQGQVPFAAARDDLFPRIFAKKSKNGTPVAGLIISSVCINALLMMNYNKNLVSQFTTIIMLAVLASLIPYLYTSMADLIIIIRRKQIYTKEKVLTSVIVAILSATYIIWAIIGSGEEIVFYGTLLLLSSAPIYVWMKWQHMKGPATSQITDAVPSPKVEY